MIVYSAYFFSKKLQNNAYTSAFLARLGIFIIALGTSILLIATSVLQGFQKKITDNINHFFGHLHIVPYTTLHDFNQTIPLQDNRIQGLKNLALISHVRPYIYKTALAYTKKGVEGVLLKGMNDFSHMKNFLCKGHLKNLKQHEVLISQTIAKKHSLHVGDKITICTIEAHNRYRKLTIQGIYLTGFKTMDQQMLLCSLDTLQQLNGWPKNTAGGYEMILKKNTFNDQKIYRQLLMHVPFDLQLKSNRHTQAALFDWLTIMKTNTSLFLIFLTLVIITSITSIMVIQMAECSYMLGVLKAVGIRNTRMIGIFLWRSISLMAQGMLWGNGIAFLLCFFQYQYHWITLQEAHYYIKYLPIDWDVRYWLWINMGLFFLMLSIITISLHWLMRFFPIRMIQHKN